MVSEGRESLEATRLGRLVVCAQNAKRLRERYPSWRTDVPDLEEEGMTLPRGAALKLEASPGEEGDAFDVSWEEADEDDADVMAAVNAANVE